MSGIIGGAGSKSGIVGSIGITEASSKTMTFTRDTATGAGNQSITGVGFRPRTIIFLAVQSTHEMSIGFSDSTFGRHALSDVANRFSNASGDYAVDAGLDLAIGLYTHTSVYYSGKPISYDIDGFTLEWFRNGSPTGVLNCQCICFR